MRKLLAPTLEAQRAEEARRVAEEAKRAEATARAAAEEKRRLEEEQARNAPPPVVVKAAPSGPNLRLLSIIPAVIGLGGAGVGTAFLLSASGKYSALKAGTIDFTTAQNYRQTGPTDATLGYIGIGVGVAGIAAAATMFALGGSSSAAPQVSVIPLRGGAFVALSFDVGGAR